MAEEALNMSLDDLIKRNKKPPRPAEEKCSYYLRPPMPENFHPYHPVHQLPDGSYFCPNAAPAPYYFNSAPRLNDKQRFWIGEAAASHQGIGDRYGGTKLYVSNLDPGVSHQDIKLLFSYVGELKRYAIHYDENGVSQGTAEVVFMRRSDALSAIRRFNKMPLDGKPINIELVASDGYGGNSGRGRFVGRYNRLGAGQRFGGGRAGGTK